MSSCGCSFVRGAGCRSPLSTRILDETLTVRGRVKNREAEGDGTRVTVEVWSRTDGVKTMVGTASGIEANA